MNEMFCFKCDKKLKSALPPMDDGRFSSQPGGGLEFNTAGHYGSAFFDPMPGFTVTGIDEYIILYICDQCLKDNEERIYYKTSRTSKQVVDDFVSGKEIKLTRIIET